MRRTGAVLLSLVTAAMLGVGATLAKYILKSVSPIPLTFLALLIGFIVSLPLIWIKRKSEKPGRLSGKEKRAFMRLSILGTVLPLVLVLYGITMTTSIKAAFLIQLQSVFGILFGKILINETIEKRKFIGIMVIFLGALMILLGDPNSIGNLLQITGISGDFLIILGAIGLGYSYSVLKKLSVSIKPEYVVSYRLLLGWVVTIPLFGVAVILGIPISEPYDLAGIMPAVFLLGFSPR